MVGIVVSMLVSIHEVVVLRAGLVLGWMTDYPVHNRLSSKVHITSKQ